VGDHQLGNPHILSTSEKVNDPGPAPPNGQKGHPRNAMIVVEEPKQAQVACGQEHTTW